MKKYFTHVTISNVVKASLTRILVLSFLFSINISEVHATAWTTGTAGDITVLSNWTNGSISPSSFTTPGDTWTVNLTMTMTASGSWTVGTASSSLVTVTFATGGALNNTTGAGGTATITIYGDLIMNGGTLKQSGSGTIQNTNIYGNATVTTGNVTVGGAGCTGNINVFGNYTMSSGSVNTAGAATGKLFTSVHGNFSMTGGAYNSAGSSSIITNYIYGNCSFSGTAGMTSTGAGTTSTVHLCLPNSSGTMLIDNTSAGTWSKTNVYVDTSCTAQLDGDFSTSIGGPVVSTSGTYGVIVNGTLICPATYFLPGNGIVTVNGVATLKVAHAGGIDAAVTTTGTKTFTASANYVFNGTVAQVTGFFLPTSLVSPDTITISNNAGVTLSQTTATTGTLLFTNGILHTGVGNTMSTPGIPAAVTGAGAASYVDGTLIKDITALSSVNYEVGDSYYVPMLLTFSSAATGGSIGLMSTIGLHPSIGTSGISPSNIVNHYWTVTNYSATGPVTVFPKATYNLSDILGGSNSSFVTQEYASAAWLPSSLATVNTSTPYTSATTPGVPLATVVGDYIFGIGCGSAITGTTNLCAGSNTPLTDATAGGTWSSGNTAVATVSASGTVYGVSAGTATIYYNTSSCSMSVIVTVGTLPITGTTTICIGSSTPLSDATPGGVWSSSNTNIATVTSGGVVYGVTGGAVNITYTFGSCTPVIAAVTVTSLGSITPVTTTVCAGSSTSLSDAIGGGVWSSGNTNIATVSGGVVYGVATGNTTIIYSLGSCSTSATVTVSGAITAITGNTTVCVGSTTGLTDATAGGVWSSSNTTVATVSGSGVVGGASAGTANITYTVGGCSVNIAVTVSGPLSAIAGSTTVCAGSTVTLSNSTGGGVWSSSNTSIATVSGGAVTGVAAGSVNITYTVGGCSVNILVNVGSAISPITGTPTTFCVGSTTTLSDATPGGTWSSSNTTIATVGGVVVTGASAGTADISYSAGGCSVTYPLTIEAPGGGTITGKDSVCLGTIHAITLSDNIAGGTWSSTNTSKATVDPVTGVVTGVANGVDTIKYVVTNTCGTYTVKYVIHVRTAAQCAAGFQPVASEHGAELKVFPNPNSGMFTLDLVSDMDEEVQVVITNIVGEKIRTISTSTNKTVDIQLDVPPGIYVLSVATPQGRYVVKVMVEK